MSKPSRTSAFTLVELLVVISIIGMLMALLLPAVQSARESSRANTCRNNLRNLALAAVQFETNRGLFPGHSNNIGPGNNIDRSWAFVLLPYLDKRSVYDQFVTKDASAALDANGTANSDIKHTLEVMLCPSDPPEVVGQASTSYAVNAGQIDHDPASQPGRKFRDYQGNGLFFYRTAPITGEVLISMSAAYISGADGMGTTIMMSENADAWTWTDVTERYSSFCYHVDDGLPGTPGANPPYPLAINVQYGQSKTGGGQPSPDKGFMRPSSYHPGGVNVAYCDARVKFMREDISYGVFQALMTPRGSQAFNNFTQTQFPSGHAATRIVDESAL